MSRLKEIAADALLTLNFKDFAFYKTIVIAECSETYRRVVKNITRINQRLALALGIMAGLRTFS